MDPSCRNVIQDIEAYGPGDVKAQSTGGLLEAGRDYFFRVQWVPGLHIRIILNNMEEIAKVPFPDNFVEEDMGRRGLGSGKEKTDGHATILIQPLPNLRHHPTWMMAPARTYFEVVNRGVTFFHGHALCYLEFGPRGVNFTICKDISDNYFTVLGGERAGISTAKGCSLAKKRAPNSIRNLLPEGRRVIVPLLFLRNLMVLINNNKHYNGIGRDVVEFIHLHP